MVMHFHCVFVDPFCNLADREFRVKQWGPEHGSSIAVPARLQEVLAFFDLQWLVFNPIPI